jgi:hypothetical protein
VVIDRARHASGALDGVPATPYNGVNMAREIARTAAAEFRADLIAGAVLRVLASISHRDGVTRLLTIYDLCGDGHRDELRRTLDAVVHPGWPDTVQRYREHHMTLLELWQEIASSSGGVFNLLAHGEAHAHAGSASSPLDVLRAHRGVELYSARHGRRWRTRSQPRKGSFLHSRPPAPTSSTSRRRAARRSWTCGFALA